MTELGQGARLGAAIAARVERAAGPRRGLAAWRLLAERATGVARAAALLEAVRCATAVADDAALAELAAAWRTAIGGWADEVAGACRLIARARLSPLRLAEAEAARVGTARALYMHARCLELEDEARATEAFVAAAERATREGDGRLVAAAQARRVIRLARNEATLAAAIEDASAIELGAVRPGDRLRLAAILLRSPSRFVRAGALCALDDLVAAPSEPAEAVPATLAPESVPGAALARLAVPPPKTEPWPLRALRLAARYADEAAHALTALEVERLDALFGRPVAIAHAPRAREVFRAARTVDPSWPRAVGLDVGRAPTPAGWVALMHALETADADRAAILAETWLDRGPLAAPPGGWSTLGAALSARGFGDLALRVLRLAMMATEPDAGRLRALSLTRAGWAAARAGDRVTAIARLREAKALALQERPPPSQA